MAITQYKPYRLTKKVGQRSFRQLIPASQDIFEYVSLGDSICAGHAIDRGWYENYGEKVQYNKEDIYGNNRGNCLTTLLPNTYTALLQNELQRVMSIKNPKVKVNATSFGHSGATVDSLVNMLREGTQKKSAKGKINTNKTYYYGDNPMTQALQNADLVTISIGANAFLTPGMDYIEGKIQEYLFSGRNTEGFVDLENVFGSAIGTLGGNGASSASIPALDKTYSYTYSYLDLIETLYLVNPNAVYRFTTVHNPFRCFYLDNDFIKSFFSAIQKSISFLPNGTDELVSDIIENSIQWKTIQENAGYLGPWVGYNIDQMNEKLNEALALFTKNNEWDIASTPVKAIFDAVPDRPGKGEIKYNDLINAQITRGYFVINFDWGALWYNEKLETNGVDDYFNKYVSPYFNSDWTPKDNINEMFEDIMDHVAEYILKYNMDPHPQNAGHEVIYRIFSDSLSDIYGTTRLNKITYNPNGGSGIAFTQKFVGSLSNANNTGKKVATITRKNSFSAQSGYRFIGWSTLSGEKSPTVPNTSEQIFDEDVSLYGQWSNQCIIKFKHTNNTGVYGAVNKWITENFGWADWSGHSQCYGLWINGIEMPDFPGFDDNHRVREDYYSVPYGSWISINVRDYTGDGIARPFYKESECHVYVNGIDQSSFEGSRRDLWYGIAATGDMEIDFKWQIAGSILTGNAQSWENCHITGFDASYQDLRQPYTVSFEANVSGGTGSMPTQKILQLGSRTVKTTLLPLNYSHPDKTYRFTGWHATNNEKPYDKQLIYMYDNWHLVAQWSNKYKLTLNQIDTSALGVNYRTTIKPRDWLPDILDWIVGDYSFDTGSNYDDRRVFYNGTNLTSNLTFDSKGSRTDTYDIEYGKPIAINVRSKQPKDSIQEYLMEGWNCWIKDGNGNEVSRGTKAVAQGTVTGDVEITLYFKSSGSYITPNDKAKVCWDVETKGITLKATTAEDW